VTLSAEASSDPDGDALSFAWNVVAGTGGGLTQPDQANAGFLAAVPGTYIVEVTVRDAGDLASSDIVVVDVRMARSSTAVAVEVLDETLIEGGSATLALYLPRAAGAGGVDVTLLSSDAGVAEAPASVHVPEGESVAAFSIEGLTAGTASITASAGGMDPASVTTTVQARVLDLIATTGPNGIVTGDSTTFSVRLRVPAPASGARVMLALSDPARGSLDAAYLDIPAGGSEATATITGRQPGALQLNASLTTGGIGAPLHLMVIPAVAMADRGSADLIDAALSAGTISEEQATIYSVQAAFGASELPSQFRGNDAGRLDSLAGKRTALRVASMSQAGQEAIGKFLFPPVYDGSWGVGVTPAQSKGSRVQRQRAADTSCFDTLRGMPRPDSLPHWKFIRTGVFKVWYPAVLNPEIVGFNWYTAQENEAAAFRVAARIQTDFEALSAVLGEVLRDGGIPCSGGDDAIDVYVTRIGWGEKAQVMPYLPGGCARPGWMWIAPDAIPDELTARNIVVHELVHLFQLRYARPDCEDWRYGILEEATATWALDFRYRTDQFEHQFLTGLPSYFDPQQGEWRASPLETGAGSIRNCNGYCDYLFFEWLSRQYSPNAIRQVLDATQSVNAQQAYETGLGGIGGGLEQLWPKFALFQWNDWRNRQHDELQGWEGERAASIAQGVTGAANLELEVTLDGNARRDMSDALLGKLRVTHGGDLPPMTANYIHLKFSDSDVARVQLEHHAKALKAQRPRFKLQALQKIDGQWRAAEDWSGEREKKYCRDKRAERIEELVLVYSNSDAGTEPFLHSGPSVVDLIDESVQPKLIISNAACMPWSGTSSVTIRNTHGGVMRFDASVTYKLFVPPGEDPEEVEKVPMQMFVPESGTASAQVDWVEEGGCTQSSTFVSGSVGELDSHVFIDFDRRIAMGAGITTIEGSVHRSQCPGAGPTEVPGPIASTWLSLGATGQPLGDDGRTLRGTFVENSTTPGVTTTYEWNFSAEREN